MSSKRKNVFAFRSFAAVTLAVWFTAQVLCIIHCNFGGGHSSADSTQRSCHSTGASHENGGNGRHSEKPGPSSVCLTLKTAALTQDIGIAVIPPPENVLYVASLTVPSLESFLTQNPSTLRPHPWPERVNTLEVCLGVACLPLAPPSYFS